MVGYKLVQIVRVPKGVNNAEELRYFSAVGNPYDKDNVEYKVGEVTVPLCGAGPLCVFTNLDDLEKYILPQTKGSDEFKSQHKIFLCSYEPSSYKSIWWSDSKYFGIGETLLSYLPAGTALASSVTLLEEVA